VPLASFALDNEEEGTCDIMIQNLGTKENTDIILGSMFLQNFNVKFTNNYNGTVSSPLVSFQGIELQISDTYAMPGVMFGNELNQNDTNPFNYSIEPVVLDITIDSTLTPTIKASVDFQGVANFKISLSDNSNFVYAQNCRSYKTSCQLEYNTDNYFNETLYVPSGDGSSSSSGMFGYYEDVKGQFCMQESNNYAVCSQNVTTTHVVA